MKMTLNWKKEGEDPRKRDDEKKRLKKVYAAVQGNVSEEDDMETVQKMLKCQTMKRREEK